MFGVSTPVALLARYPRSLLVSGRSLTSAAFRKPRNIPPPWPYQEKGFDWYQIWLDYHGTMKRMDESTKLIVVEGNIGSGKTALCEELAEAFDFKYFREPTMDDIYINRYGHDLRNLDHLVPESLKTCDIKRFYNDPTNLNVARMQLMMYYMKYENYCNALAHMLNTGQGVVMERTVFSDACFVYAMCRTKLQRGNARVPCLSPEFKIYYEDLRWHTMPRITHFPHLIIYLDVTPEQCLQNIKKRNIDYEVNSELFQDTTYLKHLETSLKQFYLLEYRDDAEVLTYDWTVPADTDDIIEDIEALDLGDDYLPRVHGDKFASWNTMHDMDSDWGRMRSKYTNKTEYLQAFDDVSTFRVGELYVHPDDWKSYQLLLKDKHCGEFAAGYNTKFGDSFAKILWDLGGWKFWKQTDQSWEEYFYKDKFYTEGMVLNPFGPGPPVPV